MAAPAIVIELVERFRQQAETYRSGSYNETQLRRDFLDPLFKALGWDMDNTLGYAEAYRDVVHEDAIRIGGAVKAPDYCFRVGGTRKFFLEAKKPQVNIRSDVSPAYQLRRYAWSAKLPLSILSDFEEIAVYDCRIKPGQDDPASKARVFYCTYQELPEKWEWLASIFSRDSVLKGSFDRYADENKAKRGTSEVDDDFLAAMEGWRLELAKNLALRNPSLSQRELNFAVQRTLDRIVFLRICEDRGLEDYGRLQKLSSGPSVYSRLCELFEDADRRYNSGLFHFAAEASRHEEPDRFTRALTIDDSLLKGLLKGLYYPDSPYEFSVISADILGQVYEQFLGKVIRLTDAHRALVEDKPEVRKAGGVFYTPAHISEYIVASTLGSVLKETTESGTRAPQRIIERVSALRVLDPACGSGSFLICAYQFLLDWHLAFYLASDKEKWSRGRSPAIVETMKGWRLTIAERKRILLNNIYGVDIDAQAVEVTKLSLLLKVLEGESQQTIAPLFSIFNERALPDLGDNIKCGNSLVASDFFNQAGIPTLSSDEEVQLNAFDWWGDSGFKEIGDKGGFDVVIGNPPYDVLEKARGESSWPHAVFSEYAKRNPEFASALGGKLNLFRFFLVKGLQLIKPDGRFGMIVPLALLGDISCGITRRHVLNALDGVLADCFPQKDNAARRVFKKAKLSTVVITGRRSTDGRKPAADATLKVRVYPWNSLADAPRQADIRLTELSMLDPRNTPVPLVSQEQWRLCVHLHSQLRCKPLGDLADFSVTRGEINQTVYKRFITKKSSDARLLKGVELGQYRQKHEIKQGEREWLDEESFLAANGARATTRLRRIATQRITGVDERLRVVATIVEPPTYFADSTNSICVAPESPYALEYLLAILNSQLMQWRFKLTSTNNNVGTNELESLPIVTIDFSDARQKAQHDRVAKLASDLMDSYARAEAARTPQEGSVFLRRVSTLERAIEAEVRSLYGITAADAALIESTELRTAAGAAIAEATG